MPNNIYDVAIIGGSFAGLSAALFLANARRKIIVIDNKQPHNLTVAKSHNFLGHEGVNPKALLDQSRQQLQGFKNLTQLDGQIDQANIKDNKFILTSDTGQTIEAKKLVLATGVYDVLPDIKNIHDFWIKNIFHCPYCIAPELIDQPLAVYSTTEEAYELALIIHKWSTDFVVLTDNNDVLSTSQEQRLKKLNIKIFKQTIDQINANANNCIDIKFSNQEILNRRGIFMHLPFRQNAQHLIDQLNCVIDDNHLIVVDDFFQTKIPGLYAIGDTSQLVQKLSTAIASGTVAGFSIDHALSVE